MALARVVVEIGILCLLAAGTLLLLLPSLAPSRCHHEDTEHTLKLSHDVGKVLRPEREK